MTDVPVDVPKELLDQLAQSRYGRIDSAARVRVALAIQLFVAEEISVGRAAELAGYPLVEFHDLLRDVGIPIAVYDREEYERDQLAADRLREPLGVDRDR
jgi:predicted HTH domain antitoxin